MTANMRFGNRWNVNELLSLQREYELLEWPIQQIAEKHRRSERAILFKLESEGFISSWEEARGFDLDKYKADTNGVALTFQDEDYDISDEEDEDDEYLSQMSDELTIIETDDERIENITNRIWNLETSVNEISSMVKQMFEVMVSKNTTPKRRPLRNY